jgi:HK97 family phage major capsid protein
MTPCEICEGSCCKTIKFPAKDFPAKASEWLAVRGKMESDYVRFDSLCPALKAGKCSIYDSRPENCREVYPVGGPHCIDAIKAVCPEKLEAIQNAMRGEVMEEQKFLVYAVKAGEDWVLNILGVPFGGPVNGKDKQGDYFDARTKVHTDKFPEVPLVYAHGFDPATMEPSREVHFIGKAKYDHTDERGHWYTAVLDRASEFAQRIWNAALKGLAGASSGTASHLMRREKDGHIAEWPVVEMTVVDGSGHMKPVNPYAVALPALKANYESAGMTLTIEPDAEAGEAQKVDITNTSTVQAEGSTAMDENKEVKETPKPAPVKAEVDMGQSVLEKLQEEMRLANEAKQKEAEKNAQLEQNIKAFVQEAMKNAPPIKGAAPAYLSKTGRGDGEMKAFDYWMRTGDKGAYKTDVFLDEATDENGAAVVPAAFYSEIVQRRAEASIIRKAPASIITVSNKTFNIPVEGATAESAPASTNESGGSTAVAADQNAVAPVDTKSITLVKYTRLHRVSDELLSDQQANLVQFLSDRVGRAFGVWENTLCFTYNTATGAVAGSTQGKEAAAAAAIAAGDVVGLYGSLLDAYVDGSCWVMAPATYAAILALTGSPFSFQNTPAGQLGGRSIMGQPVYTTAAMQAIGGGNKSVLFGNLRAGFMVAESSPMVVRRLNEAYAVNGQVGFLFSQRIGSQTVNAAALQHMIHPTG